MTPTAWTAPAGPGISRLRVEGVVEPVENPAERQALRPAVAVRARPLAGAEPQQRLRGGEVVVDLLGLAGEEDALLRFADQRGAGDAFGHAVIEGVVEVAGQERPRGVDPHGETALRDGPPRRRVVRHDLLDREVDLRGGLGPEARLDLGSGTAEVRGRD